MSNTYVIHNGRLVSEPKSRDVKGKKGTQKLTSIRVADNPPGKQDEEQKVKNPARFVTCKGWEKQGELFAKLSKGDVLTLSGQLGIEVYKDKEGNEVRDDVMRVESFTVVKSDSFYGRKAEDDDSAPAQGDDIPF